MRLKKQRKEGVLNVIHEDKIIVLLRNLELLSDLNSNRINCKFCQDTVSLDTINGIFTENDLIKISCNKPKCILALSEYLNDNNNV